YSAMQPAPSAEEDERHDAEVAAARAAALKERSQERRAGAPASEEPQFLSHLQPGRGEDVLAEVPPTFWQDAMLQYRARQAEARKEEGAPLAARSAFLHAAAPAAPGVPGTNNWIPLGPSVVRRGQPSGRPAI